MLLAAGHALLVRFRVAGGNPLPSSPCDLFDLTHERDAKLDVAADLSRAAISTSSVRRYSALAQEFSSNARAPQCVLSTS